MGNPRQAKRWLATNDPRWIRIRDAHLARQPLCVDCGSGSDPHVDHDNGRADRPEDYRASNLRTRCGSCHSVKTALENGSFGRKPGQAKAKGCDVNGTPLDRSHPWRGTQS